MSIGFEELDHAQTPYGELILRRRRVRSLGDAEVYEVKLGGEFLMSSLVNRSEIALAELGLAGMTSAASPGEGLDVAVGGLGLGHTAAAALDQPGVRSVLVVESLAAVISWHERGLVPLGARLCADGRCRIRQADFFELARDQAAGFDAEAPARRFDAVLLDIDHSPDGLLHPSHADFYEPAGLRRLREQLKPGGSFALWSSEPPEDAFSERLRGTFDTVTGHAVEFFNPLLDRDDVNAVYVCR